MDALDTKIKLRQFCDQDVELLASWLSEEYVARWYEHPQNWLDEIGKRKKEYAFIHHFIAELVGEPIGFCQYYEYCKSGEGWHGSFDTDGAYSMDYLIGKPIHLKKGYGKEIITLLTEEINAIEGARHIIVQPDPENKASCAALLSAGYIFDETNKLYFYILSREKAKAGNEQ